MEPEPTDRKPREDEEISAEQSEKENKVMMQNCEPVMKGSKMHPVSNLSASEDDEDATISESKRVKMDQISGHVARPASIESQEALSLPTMKIQAALGGKVLSFPVHPRLSLIDLKDFILFSLNIPHPQQVLSFQDEKEDKIVLLSAYSDTTLLCSVPGLIDEVTGRCAPVSLSFKMSSGMDFTVQPSDLIDYEEVNFNGEDEEADEGPKIIPGYFELSNSDSKLSALATSLASIIPLPPGVDKNSRMLFRSLSKSSPTNSNMPTLWEIYFPESGIKMMVTALINVSEVKSDNEDERDGEMDRISSFPKRSELMEAKRNNETIQKIPKLCITPEPEEKQIPVVESPNAPSSQEPKNYCEKCRVRCRPALRFICKCEKTFCQSHRYPDKHDCTFDHRAAGLATIQANNPKIVKDKVSNF